VAATKDFCSCLRCSADDLRRLRACASASPSSLLRANIALRLFLKCSSISAGRIPDVKSEFLPFSVFELLAVVLLPPPPPTLLPSVVLLVAVLVGLWLVRLTLLRAVDVLSPQPLCGCPAKPIFALSCALHSIDRLSALMHSSNDSRRRRSSSSTAETTGAGCGTTRGYCPIDWPASWSHMSGNTCAGPRFHNCNRLTCRAASFMYPALMSASWFWKIHRSWRSLASIILCSTKR
jgi:hypothetical protein